MSEACLASAIEITRSVNLPDSSSFPRSKQSFNGLAFCVENATVQVRFNAAQAFAADDVGANGDQWPTTPVINGLELAGSKLVRLVLPE